MGESSPPEGSVEYFVKLGMTPDEAKSFSKSWGYKQPEDINKLQEQAGQAHRYEETMRGLNFDKSSGTIDDEKYQELAAEAQDKIFGK